MPSIKNIKNKTFSLTTAPVGIMAALGLIFIPFINIPISLLQYQILYLLLGVWLLLISKKLWKTPSSSVELPSTWFFAIPGLLFLVMLVSALLSGAFAYSFFDHGLDNTSILVFMTLLAIFLATYYLNLKHAMQYFYGAIQAVFAVNLIVFALNIWTPLNITSSASAGILPNIFDLGALATVTFFVSLFKLTDAQGFKKWLNILFAGLSLLLLVFLNIFANWLALLIFTLVALRFFTSDNRPVKTYLMLFALLLSVGFLMFGSQIQRQTVKLTGTNFVIINPSGFASNAVVQNVYANSVKNKLLGSGPSTFKNDWDRYKPADLINTTPYWNTAFTYAYSLLATYFATTGVLGGLMLLLFIAYIYFYLVKLFFVEPRVAPDQIDTIHAKRYVFLSALLLSLMLYGAPGIFVLFAGMLISAVALKELVYIGMINRIKLNPVSSNRMSKLGAAASFVFGVVFVVYFANSVLGLTISQITYRYLQQGNIDRAMQFASVAQAVSIEKDSASNLSGLVIKAKIDAISAQITQNQNKDDKNKTADLQKELTKYLDDMVMVSESAVKYNPLDYRNHIALAAAYSNKYVANKDEDTYAKATDALNKASELAPGNPIVPFNMALLALLKQDVQSAQAALGYAINLKPDFDAAYASLTEIALSQKADKVALQIAQTAVQNAPSNPNAWLRLAYLLYQNKDYKNASIAFERSIAISGRPDVNTLYVLALTYNSLKEYDKALNILNNLKKVVANKNIDNLISQIEEAKKQQKTDSEDGKTSKSSEKDNTEN